MAFDSDVALLGTGVASLVAAARLLAEGKSVLLLNPDWDFFSENSELPLDPLSPLMNRTLTPQKLRKSLPDQVAAELRPNFPGAVEVWSSTAAPSTSGFRDEMAPHVRARSRLWIHADSTSPRPGHWDWESLETVYVEASDAGMSPQLSDGLVAIRKFPGIAKRVPEIDEVYRGLTVPKICDVDVTRYRNGLLEFVRERLGPERVLCAASQIDITPDGVRFHWQGSARTARLREGLLCFWTPRMTPWILAQAKRAEVQPRLPQGVRIWEEWSVLSRDALDPSIVGVFEDLVVWASLEGAPVNDPRKPYEQLSVLRPGPRISLEEFQSNVASSSLASQESFRSLARLCLDFLRWDHFRVRSMRPRSILDWGDTVTAPWRLGGDLSRAFVVGGCDGPLVEVVRAARAACVPMLSGGIP